MKLPEKTVERMPPHLRALLVKLPNPGREEVMAAFPDGKGGGSTTPRSPRREGSGWERPANLEHHVNKHSFDGQGSAARFFKSCPFTEDEKRLFYSAKADKSDRLESKHPTVKPVDLMRWLVRLITPPNGTVLDPFAGSGTTGMACMAEGFDAILIEREAAYVADIRRRIAHVSGDDTPLFTRAAE